MKGYIVLETGDIFEGDLYNHTANINGELIFYTGMTGYESILTDPSTKGQIIVFTYPFIGNCGINEAMRDVPIQANGFIVSEIAEEASHYEAALTLSEYSERHATPFLTGIDTRTIVKRIREHGSMRAVLTTDPKHVPNKHIDEGAVEKVSVEKLQTFGDGATHVIMIDYGYKQSIVDSLIQKGFKVTVVPYKTSFSEIKELHPDLIIYTNGPGNPIQHQRELTTIKKVASTYPTFGIGLGHQLLALAFGGETERLPYGHHGISEPVIDRTTNKVYMTAQNHSYIVKEQSIEGTGFQLKFSHINDRSVEGLVHESYPIMTTQFHPIGTPGPSDTESFFFSVLERFLSKGREKVYA